MNTLLKLPNNMTRQRGLTLLLTTDKARAGITELIAALVLSGPLFVIAGSEWLPAYELTRTVRRNTLEVRQVLNRLHTVRASTCYRLLDSLVNIPPQGEPLLILDLLHTFYDPDIPLRVRLFKLRACCRQLSFLALHRPVVVMTQKVMNEDHEKFCPMLLAVTDRTFTLAPELEQTQQPSLF